MLEDQLLGRGLLFRRQVAGFRLPSEFDRTLESAWELRHLIAQDTRSLQYYLGMLWPRPLFASAETGSRTIPGTKLRRPATLPPGMVKLRRDYFIALCEESALLDDSVGLLLDPDLYDDAQKQAATVAIEAHLARVNGTAGLPADYAVEWRKPAGPDRKSVPSVPGVSKALRSTNAEPLHIDRLWLEPKPDQDGLSVTNCLYQAVWAENAIWFFSETEGEFDRTKPRTASVQRLDLESFQMKAFPMPKQPGDANGHRAQTRVLVTPALLVVTCPGRYLALCDRASGKWEYFPAIKPDGVGVLLDDRFFIPVKDEQSAGVMSFDLATKTTELLVSSRRNPAISPLDDPGLRLKAAFANEAGDFVLTVSSIAPDGRKGPFWAWSPSARTWRESGSEKPAKDFTRRMDGFINLGTVQPVSEAQEDGDLRMVMNQMGGWVIKGLPLLVEFKRPPGVVFTKYGFTSSTGQPTSRRPEMWRQCPQGYFFVSDNRRLWFLPQEQFDAFTKASSKTKSE